MLRGNLRYILGAFGGLAALAGLGTASLYSYREFYEPAEYDNAAQHYQPARDSTQQPAPIEKQPRAKVYDPHCEQPKNKDDADLCAQWAAVRAVSETNRLTRIALRLGYIGFWIAFMGGVIGIVGTAFLIKTFRENRRSADAAAVQVKMMQEAQLPDFVVGNMTYLRRTGPQSTEYVKEPTTDGFLQVSFANRNRTSLAYTLPSRFGWRVADALPAEPIYDQDVPIPVNKDPHPGDAISFFFDIPLSDEQVQSLLKREASLWVWVRMQARDIYKGIHTLGIAARWVPDGFQPAPHDDLMWGNYFQAVLDPAHNCREYESA